MASSLAAPKTHARSVSLPSKPHLLALQVDDCLESLWSSEVKCSSYSIQNKLNDLIDLYECVDEVLKLQSTWQTVRSECHKEWVDQVMDGSLRLLDVCGVAKDVLSQTKEAAEDFQSSLRRKRGDRAELASEVSNYMTSRRNVKKIIHRSLRNLTSQDSLKDHRDIAVAKLLLGIEEATNKVFESLLWFISGPGAQLKPSKWGFISKLMLSKPGVTKEDSGEVCDFATVDAALQTINNQKTYGSTYLAVQDLQKKLVSLELNIQDLEEAMDCIFRHQIKARVSLLNILSH